MFLKFLCKNKIYCLHLKNHVLIKTKCVSLFQSFRKRVKLFENCVLDIIKAFIKAKTFYVKIQWSYYLKCITRNFEENKFFKTYWYIFNVKATLLKTSSWQKKMFQEDFPMLIKPSKTFGGETTHSSCSQLYSRLYTPLHEYNTSLSSTSNKKNSFSK